MANIRPCCFAQSIVEPDAIAYGCLPRLPYIQKRPFSGAVRPIEKGCIESVLLSYTCICGFCLHSVYFQPVASCDQLVVNCNQLILKLPRGCYSTKTAEYQFSSAS